MSLFAATNYSVKTKINNNYYGCGENKFFFIYYRGRQCEIHAQGFKLYFSSFLSLFTERIKIGKAVTVGHKHNKFLKANFPHRDFRSMLLYDCSSAVGSLKTIFAQRLFGEKADIKANMMPTAAISPIAFLQHITMVFTLVVVFVHRVVPQ